MNKSVGQQHPGYATSLNNLAELYRAQGQYEPALPLYQEALKIREQVLGKQHPDYALSLNNLDPDYATSLNNFAWLYRAQGQYEQALPLSQEALKIFTKVLGEQHPLTQMVKRNYLRCLSESGAGGG